MPCEHDTEQRYKEALYVLLGGKIPGSNQRLKESQKNIYMGRGYCGEKLYYVIPRSEYKRLKKIARLHGLKPAEYIRCWKNRRTQLGTATQSTLRELSQHIDLGDVHETLSELRLHDQNKFLRLERSATNRGKLVETFAHDLLLAGQFHECLQNLDRLDMIEKTP